jgi:hypothetical protein
MSQQTAGNGMANLPTRATTVFILSVACVGKIFSGQADSLRKDTTVAAHQSVVEWKLEDLNNTKAEGVTRVGDPHAVDCPYGKAVHFDGTKDGLFLNTNPLENLDQFTIEVIFQPDGKAPQEQRFLHMGEVRGDRLLLETRVTDDDRWCLDAFLLSGNSSQTLIDKNKLHPTEKWYHIAFVVDDGKTSVYIDGQLELDGKIEFSPMKAGATSIGVRMNKVSWFKGAIYKIRITPKCLIPAKFMRS